MEESDIVHVAINPPGILETGLVDKVATITNKDSYTTRLLLTGKIPKIIAQYQTIEKAESIAQSLRSQGLVAFVCKDSELRKPFSGQFRADRMKLEDGKITFWNNNGVERIVLAEEVFLIIQGTMQTYAEKELTKTTMKFNLTSTLLTGGLPIWREVKEKAKDVSTKTESFIRLYDIRSLEPSVEIFQNSFNYSFLGQKMTFSSLTNLSATASEFRNALPQAISDDSLTKSFTVHVLSASLEDSSAINCKLIFLYYRTVNNLGQSV